MIDPERPVVPAPDVDTGKRIISDCDSFSVAQVIDPHRDVIHQELGANPNAPPESSATVAAVDATGTKSEAMFCDRLIVEQMARQRTKDDCGIYVFAELTGLSADEIKKDVPDPNETSDEEWAAWLRGVGFEAHVHRGPSPATPPLAFVYKRHWFCQYSCGGIGEPSGSLNAFPQHGEQLCEFLASKETAVSVPRNTYNRYCRDCKNEETIASIVIRPVRIEGADDP